MGSMGAMESMGAIEVMESIETLGNGRDGGDSGVGSGGTCIFRVDLSFISEIIAKFAAMEKNKLSEK